MPPPGVLQPLLAKVPFSNFRYPHVDENENVTFIADDPVYNGKAARHGIYRSIARTGELQPLVRQGETLVPGTSVALDWFRGLQMDGPDFVFNATDKAGERGLYYWTKGALRTIARSHQTLLPGAAQTMTDVEYGALAHGHILYNARAGNENLLVLYSLGDDRARVLSRSEAPIPGRSGEAFR